MRAVDYARRLYSYTNIDIPPIDMNPILKEFGIELRGIDLAYVDAVLIKDKSFPVIGYNVNKPIERQRFSIAHEIGHFFYLKIAITVYVILIAHHQMRKMRISLQKNSLCQSLYY
ncbi:MAG: ImmA/IrrE family metallo-endopeptidase [bacterium]